MIYSDLYLPKEKKLPTAIGFIFIFIIAVFFSRLVFNSAQPTVASLKVAKRVEVVNMSPTQVSIFWQTDRKESGWVIYGDTENKENKIIADEKDLSSLDKQKGKNIFLK